MSALRPYQVKLLADVRASFAEGHRAVLMVLPCGGGKTRVAAEILRMSVARGRRCVFLAELDVLLQDTHERIVAAGMRAGYVQAGRPVDPEAPIQIASLDTLHSRGFYPPGEFLFLDEAHGACAATVTKTLEAYPNAKLLGGTATPQRGDGQPLGSIFAAMVLGPTVRELVAGGYLVHADVLSPPAPIEGGIACEPLEAWQRWADGRRAIVFAASVEHAEHMTATFREAGVAVECITGETSRAVRDGLRARLVAGETRVLVGVNVFTQGWDCPPVEVAILARGFSVCGTYLQAVGRVLRPSPETGKTRALILDLTGCAILHGLPADERIWSLEGDAVRRTGPALEPLVRCADCLAIFHPAPACPRCGVSAKGARLPRRATRIERAELSRLDTRPQELRDALALRAIENRLRKSGRIPPWKLKEVAAGMLARSRRAPKTPAP